MAAEDFEVVAQSPAAIRVRLDIAYDGTDFVGWARQPQLRTVQGVLEDALSVILRQQVRLTVAGRTDAGVHAEGQVAHCDIAAAPDGPGLVRRLARFLPTDVRVKHISVVPTEFDARFSALRRHYTYRLTTAPYGADPLWARWVVPAPGTLDVATMREASQSLVGLHDFAAFCRQRPGSTTIRELQRFDWVSKGPLLMAHLSADAFCWSMVRGLVGALLAVGAGRRSVGWPEELLQHRTRCSAITVAPARGLSLAGVDYPPDADLAARNARTRDIRTALTSNESDNP